MDHADRPWMLATSLSVEQGRDAYLSQNGFGIDEYEKPSVEVSYAGIRIRVPNPESRKRAIRLHDLHHVATGYGTDPIGEAEISAWELRNGIRDLGWYVGTIVLSGALAGMFISPRRTLAAFRAAKTSRSLFPKATCPEYATLLHMSIGELRAHLGVPDDGLAANEPGLHAAAPKPGASAATGHAK